MKPMVNLLKFGGSLSLHPVPMEVAIEKEREERIAMICNTRLPLGCDEAKMSCVGCRQGCPYEGQTAVKI